MSQIQPQTPGFITKNDFINNKQLYRKQIDARIKYLWPLIKNDPSRFSRLGGENDDI